MGRSGPQKAADIISKWMTEEYIPEQEVMDAFTPRTVVLGSRKLFLLHIYAHAKT